MRVQISPLLMFLFIDWGYIHGNGRLNIEECSTITIIAPRSHINILKILEVMLTFSIYSTKEIIWLLNRAVNDCIGPTKVTYRIKLKLSTDYQFYVGY